MTEGEEMNVKELIENRNAKVAQMEGLLTTAKAENRLPSEDEKKQFANLERKSKTLMQLLLCMTRWQE